MKNIKIAFIVACVTAITSLTACDVPTERTILDTAEFGDATMVMDKFEKLPNAIERDRVKYLKASVPNAQGSNVLQAAGINVREDLANTGDIYEELWMACGDLKLASGKTVTYTFAFEPVYGLYLVGVADEYVGCDPNSQQSLNEDDFTMYKFER